MPPTTEASAPASSLPSPPRSFRAFARKLEGLAGVTAIVVLGVPVGSMMQLFVLSALTHIEHWGTGARTPGRPR